MRTKLWTIVAAAATMTLVGCSSIKPHQIPVVDASSYQSGSRSPVTSSGTMDLLPAGSVQSSGRVHTVALGDTLYNIALRYGIDARELATLNSIVDPTSLRIGQQLFLPAGAKTYPRVQKQPSSVVVSRVPQNGLDTKPKPEGAAQTKPSVIASTPEQDTVRTVKPIEPEVKPDLSGLPEKSLPGSKLIWPVAGKIVSAFGQNGKGVDISGTKGDIVVAASDGVVLFAGSGVKGYGNLVIIKHTSTLVTAYGHNDKIIVKVGDKVKAGQKIAEMGVVGTQPLLRFEVRVKGKAENPRLYLPKARR